MVVNKQDVSLVLTHFSTDIDVICFCSTKTWVGENFIIVVNKQDVSNDD